jgi:hypothetical protein
MRSLMSVAAFAAALTMTAPVWAQTSEQLNQQELSTMNGAAPGMPAAMPPVPAYAGAPAPAYGAVPAYAGAPAPAYPYPYPYPSPYYGYPAYDPYAYYGAPLGIYVGGCCWGGGWHGGWGGGGGWHGGGGGWHGGGGGHHH